MQNPQRFLMTQRIFCVVKENHRQCRWIKSLSYAQKRASYARMETTGQSQPEKQGGGVIG